MPLLRYFLFVGAALLALMFASDAVLPRPPATGIASGAKLPVIRIHSERKGPEAVVLDTRTVTPLTARTDAAAAAETPATVRESSVRESFAQFLQLQTRKVVASEPTKGGPKPPAKGTVVRTYQSRTGR